MSAPKTTTVGGGANTNTANSWNGFLGQQLQGGTLGNIMENQMSGAGLQNFQNFFNQNGQGALANVPNVSGAFQAPGNYNQAQSAGQFQGGQQANTNFMNSGILNNIAGIPGNARTSNFGGLDSLARMFMGGGGGNFGGGGGQQYSQPQAPAQPRGPAPNPLANYDPANIGKLNYNNGAYSAHGYLGSASPPSGLLPGTTNSGEIPEGFDPASLGLTKLTPEYIQQANAGRQQSGLPQITPDGYDPMSDPAVSNYYNPTPTQQSLSGPVYNSDGSPAGGSGFGGGGLPQTPQVGFDPNFLSYLNSGMGGQGLNLQGLSQTPNLNLQNIQGAQGMGFGGAPGASDLTSLIQQLGGLGNSQQLNFNPQYPQTQNLNFNPQLPGAQPLNFNPQLPGQQNINFNPQQVNSPNLDVNSPYAQSMRGLLEQQAKTQQADLLDKISASGGSLFGTPVAALSGILNQQTLPAIAAATGQANAQQGQFDQNSQLANQNAGLTSTNNAANFALGNRGQDINSIISNLGTAANYNLGNRSQDVNAMVNNLGTQASYLLGNRGQDINAGVSNLGTQANYLTQNRNIDTSALTNNFGSIANYLASTHGTDVNALVNSQQNAANYATQNRGIDATSNAANQNTLANYLSSNRATDASFLGNNNSILANYLLGNRNADISQLGLVSQNQLGNRGFDVSQRNVDANNQTANQQAGLQAALTSAGYGLQQNTNLNNLNLQSADLLNNAYLGQSQLGLQGVGLNNQLAGMQNNYNLGNAQMMNNFGMGMNQLMSGDNQFGANLNYLSSAQNANNALQNQGLGNNYGVGMSNVGANLFGQYSQNQNNILNQLFGSFNQANQIGSPQAQTVQQPSMFGQILGGLGGLTNLASQLFGQNGLFPNAFGGGGNQYPGLTPGQIGQLHPPGIGVTPSHPTGNYSLYPSAPGFMMPTLNLPTFNYGR